MQVWILERRSGGIYNYAMGVYGSIKQLKLEFNANYPDSIQTYRDKDLIHWIRQGYLGEDNYTATKVKLDTIACN